MLCCGRIMVRRMATLPLWICRLLQIWGWHRGSQVPRLEKTNRSKDFQGGHCRIQYVHST